ncbi:MAG: cysteine-rich repeat protein [Hyphomicrobiaceae bacterium]
MVDARVGETFARLDALATFEQLDCGDGCDANCQVAGCGNGIAAGAEACDDGNLLSLDGCSATCTREPYPYLCYKVKNAKDDPKFVKVLGLSSIDDFGSRTNDVVKRTLVCVPASINGSWSEAVADGEVLRLYRSKASKGQPKFEQIAGERYQNIVGDRVGAFTAKKPVDLLFHSVGSDVVDPPLLPGAFVADEAACYKAKDFDRRGAKNLAVEDRFGELTLDARTVKAICNPANIDATNPGAEAAAVRHLCFKVRASKGAQKFSSTGPYFTTTVFESEELTVRKPFQLCIPSVSVN